MMLPGTETTAMSNFHDRIFGDINESALSDGYNHGPYREQYTNGPKAGDLMMKPKGASWTYNSIHVQPKMQGPAKGVGNEQGDPNYGHKNESQDGESRLQEAMAQVRNLLG